MIQLQRECPKLKYLEDRKSTRLNSSHSQISYAVFCLKKKKNALYLLVSVSCTRAALNNLLLPPVTYPKTLADCPHKSLPAATTPTHAVQPRQYHTLC